MAFISYSRANSECPELPPVRSYPILPYVFCECASGARARERGGRGKNTYGVSVQVFVR